MTTIAWDGDVLAWDSLMCCGSLVVAKDYQKAFMTDERICIGAGNAAQVRSVCEHLLGLRDSPDLVEPCFEILLFDRTFPEDNVRLFNDEPHSLSVPEPTAIGSGSSIAISALRLGKDAKRAILLACELDIYTGGSIYWMRPFAKNPTVRRFGTMTLTKEA